MTDAEPPRHEAFVHQRWIAGTYIVSGVFPRDGTDFRGHRAMDEIPVFYAVLREMRKWKLPRGLAAYHVIPIYVADSFDRHAIDWVSYRHPYRYAIWYEPVLYNARTNNASIRKDYGLMASAFYPQLRSMMYPGLAHVARLFDHPFPTINEGLNPLENVDLTPWWRLMAGL